MFKKLTVIFVFLTTIYISSRPLLSSGMFRTHDYVHGTRIAELFRAVSDGHLPVRWSENFGYGYGMPLFQFYAPLPYYFGAAIYWLSNDLLFASKLLWVLPSIIGFVGMYRWVSARFGRMAGVVAAVLFTLAPYRAVDLYIRGAIGEIWGMAFFPWILWSSENVLRTGKKWIFVTLSWIGLILSHNLMTVFFVPFVLIYGAAAVVVDLRSKKRKGKSPFGNALVIVGSTILAMGMTTFYTVPAILESHLTQMADRILDGYFHYSNHFLYIRQFFQENWKYGGSFWGPNDDLSLFLGFPQLLLLILAIVVWLFAFFRQLYQRKKISTVLAEHWWLAVVILLVFVSLGMTLQRSKSLWDAITFLHVAQFPWRFLTFATVFIAAAGSFLFVQLKGKLRLLLFFSIMLSSWGWGLKYFQPDPDAADANGLYYSDTQLIRTQMSQILPDYMPISLPLEPLPRAGERYQIIDGDAEESTVLVDRTHEFALRTRSNQPLTLDVLIAVYPGWKFFLGMEEILPVPTQQGMYRLEIPRGEHIVSTRFTSTPIRRWSDIISLIGWFIFAILTIKWKNEVSDSKGKLHG